MRSRKVFANLLISIGLVLLLLAGVSFAHQSRRLEALPLRGGDVATAPALLPSPTTPTLSVRPTVTQVMAEKPAATATDTRTSPSGTPTATMTKFIIELSATAAPTLQEITATATAYAPPSGTPTLATKTPTATPPPPRIVIPKISVNASISEVTWRAVQTSDGIFGLWETAEVGVGHHRNSAQPGEQGNVVLSGHGHERGSLTRLSELVAGDEILVYVSENRVYRYIVSESVMLPEVGASLAEKQANARYMEPTHDARLTLITCWPSWAYTHRLIVIAKLATP